MSALFFVVALTQDSISADSRLRSPINLDESLVPLSRFVDEASAATGLTFTASKAVRNLKVDAFVDNMPVGKTLEKVAQALDLKWTRTGTGYELDEDPSKAALAQAYMQAENELAGKKLLHNIAVYVDIAKLVPADSKPDILTTNQGTYRSMLDQTQRDLTNAISNRQEESEIEKLSVRRDALTDLSSGHPNLSLARLFSLMSAEDMESFQNGLPYIAVSEAGGKFTLSPSDLPKAFGPASGSTKYALFAYVDPDTKQIGYKDLGYTENIRAIGGNYPGRYPFATIPAELKQNDFVAELNAWDQKSELSRTMTQAITPSSKRQAEFSSSWFGKRYRLGDHLRWFHRATGVNVIAPANRSAHPWMKLSRPDATQGEYVADLMKSSGGYAQMSDGYLMVRDGNYWRKAANEIPEEVFAPLELGMNSATTMSDYAGFMSKLNSIQSTLVQDREGFVVRFDRYPVSLAGPALRFVNSLSEGNVYQAGTSTGLPYDSLNPSQRKLFARAVVQGISDQGFITPGLVDYLGVNGYQYQSLDKMSFHLRSMKMKVTRDPVVVNDNGESIESLPLSVKTCATMHFEFGYNDQSLIKYYADVN